VTEFSETFLVFYKWPDLTDVQGIVHSTVAEKQQITRAINNQEEFSTMHGMLLISGHGMAFLALEIYSSYR
jgi:hypothetical protein